MGLPQRGQSGAADEAVALALLLPLRNTSCGQLLAVAALLNESALKCANLLIQQVIGLVDCDFHPFLCRF
jgi:hypothetical protein